MTETQKPRVFLLTDYFTRSKDYYLVATDKNDAIERARFITPIYTDEHDEVLEGTELQEEVGVLALVRTVPPSARLQRVYLLPVYKAEESDAYYGYEISQDGKIRTTESAYLKSEWRLEEE